MLTAPEGATEAGYAAAAANLGLHTSTGVDSLS